MTSLKNVMSIKLIGAGAGAVNSSASAPVMIGFPFSASVFADRRLLRVSN